MNRLTSSINSTFKSINISENDIQSVNGEVNEEMKLSGWMLVELKDEKCVMIEMNDRKEIEEGYLLDKEKVLERKGKELSDTNKETIDKENGIRFDGRVFEGIPFGFGYLFDENGNKIYEGIMINWNRMGYGTSYSDKGMMEYEGTWCNDLRCGYGKSFDNEGNVIFEGNWFNGNRIEYDYNGDGNDLNIQVKRLKLNDECILNDFDVSLFLHLEELVIGNDCFSKVNLFKIDGLNHLKSIKIGNNSFTLFNSGDDNYSSRSFSILNCIELESIEIGRYSFCGYGGFELRNLPKLSTIKIGSIEFDYSELNNKGKSLNFYFSSFMIKGNIELLLLMNRSSTFEFHYIR